ncbi:MAG: efflux RND transporter periplasmic adaptor subunit [Xanthomonadales bacterium]|nr:efflux RND transporter periplasmic adaptor subunit [Xanthomonadales bacterium]
MRVPVAMAMTLIILAGCGTDEQTVPAVEVQRIDREFRVLAEGELVASESLPIALPPSVRMGFNIAWMAPEFSEVKAGDVIARFDDVQVRLDRDATSLEVAKTEFDLANTIRSGEIERSRIEDDAQRVEGEKEISETFANADQRFFSRNELIDALADLDFLAVQAAFLDWQAETYDQRTQAEQNLILAAKQGHLSKLEKQNTALEMMELRSPADGTFIYARTPWGEKLGKGKTVFPGMPVGLLPVAGKVRAKLYVPESDAVGLEPGQAVRFRLDSLPTRLFGARVDTVSPVASPKQRDDPQKFFTVEATIDDVDAGVMRVGSRLRAEIITESIEDGIIVPAQAVHDDDGGSYVFVVDDGPPRRQTVTVGRRSPDLVEITAGLAPGDSISLVTPAANS